MGTLSQIVVRLRLGGKSVVKNAHLMVQMDSFLPTLHLPHSNVSLMFAKPLASWITYGTRHSPFHGLYSSTQVGCETCPVGHYSKEQGATRVCTPCSRGEYQSCLGHDESLGSYRFTMRLLTWLNTRLRETEQLDDSFDTSQHKQSKGRPL